MQINIINFRCLQDAQRYEIRVKFLKIVKKFDHFDAQHKRIKFLKIVKRINIYFTFFFYINRVF
ncbi:hypothetical protein C7B79_15680 [Chroococcidiopsis cubana CCALA 043]|nr:hypothetical protein C7B79_15680 [Chroococcidiopsis cubana CCALA 043]